MALGDVLTNVGTRAFGLGLPLLSPRWTAGSSLPTVTDDGMALSLTGTNWVAPVAGAARQVNPSTIGVTLLRSNGVPASGPGLLLTLFPHAYLRLARLYAQILEDAASPRPGRARGLPARPVPRYFLFSGASLLAAGHVNSGDDLSQDGELTAYDNEGFPIDLLATASAFQALTVKHNPLQARDWNAVFDANPQLKQIADLAGTAAVVRVRLSDHAGMPRNSTNLTGISNVAAGSGLFSLDASAGAGSSDLTGTINKASSTGTTGAFPDDVRDFIKLGIGTTGRMGDTVTFPPKPATVTLPRDYFSVRVVNYKPYLLGTPDPAYDGTKVHKPAKVRVAQTLDLLTDGNDILGAATTALTGTTAESLAVAQTIDGAFTAPAAAGAAAHWPAFPTMAAAAAPAGSLSPALKTNLSPAAQWHDDGNPATADIDVVLSLNGLPEEAAVRVYNRKFVADAKEERGDGAGGVVSAAGTLSVLLKDPFGLRRPGLAESAITIPANATLHVDVAVVKRTGESRIFGNVTAPVDPPTTAIPPAGAPNLFATAARRGISSAPVLGLPAPSLSGLALSDPLEAALQLAGEANPRDASRLPTMARRELIVAGLAAAAGGEWKSVLSGGRLTGETISAQSRMGAPGSPGGRETQATGVSSQNGLLAYDIARMAFRRTTNIVDRLVELAGSQWDEPPSPTPGTMVAAVLQTIAPFCETPELHVLRSLIDPDSTTRPKTWDDLVDWVKANLAPALLPDHLPFRQELLDQLDNLKGNAKGTRLFDETEREIMSAGWGRRDAQWALKDAIASARRFIYIESPGIAMTRRDYGSASPPPYAMDLFDAISSRLIAMPGLRVIFCSPKFADFAPGYEPFAANEVANRRDLILGLPTASDPNRFQSRVVAFHPIGFPGRASRIETSLVIVDDLWALVGSSTFRRRGLSFDGGADVVCSDMELDDGVSPVINLFRRKVMADRLGLFATAFPEIPDATETRLRDGVEAFYAIREMLVAGGLGRIERLWNGVTEGVSTLSPTVISKDLANPDGEEFQLAATLAITGLASLNSHF